MTRSKNGQFAKGNPGGPGRPPRQTEKDYLLAMTEIVTLDDWRQIVELARQQALKGDHTARKWLADTLLGSKPNLARAQAIEAAGLDEGATALLEIAGYMFQNEVSPELVRSIANALAERREKEPHTSADNPQTI